MRTDNGMLCANESSICWFNLPDDLLEYLQAEPGVACATSVALPTGPGWAKRGPTTPSPIQPSGITSPVAGEHSLQQMSRQAIRQAVDASQGNLSQAARRLGISRQTLYRKLAD